MALTLAHETRLNGTTQYTNYQFQSSIDIPDGTLIASDSGLFLVGGDTDNGTDISAHITLADDDFESSTRKHARTLYLDFIASGTLAITSFFDGVAGTPKQITGGGYALRSDAIPQDVSLRGRSFRAKIANVAGCFFSLQRLEGFFILMHRRAK